MSRFLLTTGIVAVFLAPSVYAADNKLELTIYGDGRALVDDTRDVNYGSGVQSITLPGVSSAILPQSVTIRSDDIEILEQNFDFDLLTPAKLMEKAVGQHVEIFRINPATKTEEKRRAKVLSVNNGTVIEIDGNIEVLRSGRVIFPKVPDNLRAEPTLSLKLDTDRPGTRPLALSYLTSGITWEADYVMSFDESSKQMNLQGWATLENLTQTRFENADLSVIAGYVGTINNQYNYNNQNDYYRFYQQRFNQISRNKNRNVNVHRSGGTEASSQERVGDNLIYRLPHKTTLAANQKKQIALVAADNVTAEKAYEFNQRSFRSQSSPISVESRISFSNSRAAGLGEALPAGTIRVYTKDQNDKSQFIGEQQIGHIAGGSQMSLKLGQAFDITAKPTLVKSDRVSDDIRDYEMRYDLKNASENDVTVRLSQYYESRADYTVLSESQQGQDDNIARRYWDVTIPAQGSSTLEFRVREDRT